MIRLQNAILSIAEGSHSGLVRSLGKRVCRKASQVRILYPPLWTRRKTVCQKWHRGFESLPFRKCKSSIYFMRDLHPDGDSNAGGWIFRRNPAEAVPRPFASMSERKSRGRIPPFPLCAGESEYTERYHRFESCTLRQNNFLSA